MTTPMHTPPSPASDEPATMAARAAMAPLKNSRHEMFCLEFVKGKSLFEAYLAVGYYARNRKTLRDQASRLARTPKVAARIRALKEIAAANAVISVHSLIEELEQARIMAMANNQTATALSAVVTKAKLAGFLGAGDKPGGGKQQASNKPVDPESLSDADLAAIIMDGYEKNPELAPDSYFEAMNKARGSSDP